MDTRSNAVRARGRGSVDGVCLLNDRALALWPRLDRRKLRRCGCDPMRIVALVSRRTNLPREAILRLLMMPTVGDDEAVIWFG